MIYSDKKLLSLQLNDSNASLSRFPSIENIEYIDVLKLNKSKRQVPDIKNKKNFNFANIVFPSNMSIYKENTVSIKRKNSFGVSNESKKNNKLIESFKKKQDNRIIKEKNLNITKVTDEKKPKSDSKILASKKTKKLEEEMSGLSIQDQSTCSNCPYCIEEEKMDHGKHCEDKHHEHKTEECHKKEHCHEKKCHETEHGHEKGHKHAGGEHCHKDHKEHH
ncbi:Hypothetical protein SRAE_1000087600 [Strongyloides ratti]|uniref:Uncharacterized protein n=1 Tax=Strongyloides ratti TaxID=34506 RepID=A0A090KYU0_STRRB|nr:Hypothetical protein SRAE_1000087600 [Strongyloides ratti]CEF62606.1 Hypothetical protein SRAE_1000087600 [Strongyloides ratti]